MLAYSGSVKKRDIIDRFGTLLHEAIARTFGSFEFYYESGADLKYQAWAVRNKGSPFYPQRPMRLADREERARAFLRMQATKHVMFGGSVRLASSARLLAGGADKNQVPAAPDIMILCIHICAAHAPRRRTPAAAAPRRPAPPRAAAPPPPLGTRTRTAPAPYSCPRRAPSRTHLRLIVVLYAHRIAYAC
jgi:hypothetical protein